MREKTKVMRIARETSPVQIMAKHRQLDNVEYFYYLGSMITNDARYENKSMVAMAKTDSSPTNGT
jgi:hypothetical protein